MKALNTLVLIPAFNEEQTIGQEVQSIPPKLVQEIMVVDIGSTDLIPKVAGYAGERVVTELRRGYGNACLSGMASLPRSEGTLVFTKRRKVKVARSSRVETSIEHDYNLYGDRHEVSLSSFRLSLTVYGMLEILRRSLPD